MFGQWAQLQPAHMLWDLDLRLHTKFYTEEGKKKVLSRLFKTFSPFRNHRDTGSLKMVMCQRNPAVSGGGSVICAVKTFLLAIICSTADAFVLDIDVIPSCLHIVVF